MNATAVDRPDLRDCPFCHTKGSDDEKLHLMENHIVYSGGSYAASYSIFCTGCGVQLHDEYLDDLVSMWNGEKPKREDDEAVA